MIYKWIYTIGSSLRNPSLKSIDSFLKSSNYWDINQLQEYQLQTLQELVKYAYNNSNYYNKKYNKEGVKPSDIKTLKDIIKLPKITKAELLQFNNSIHTSYKDKKQFKAKTSGTSGESLSFTRNEYSDSFNRASINRGYSWHRVKPWECNAYFWGYDFSMVNKLKTRLLDKLQNRFRLFSYSDNSVTKFIAKLKSVSYIHGYSSSIFQVAKAINTKGHQKPKNIKMVKGTSEKVFDNYQKEIQNAFGVKMINEYGAAESGIIAFECPHGSMHINMEGVIVEEVENRILVTNLHMLSFPIIRYDLGDFIKLAPKDKKCKCGRNHLIIEDVLGRVGKNVYGKTNTYPSLYFYYIFKNIANKHKLYLDYQVVQKTNGKLEFNISKTLLNSDLKILNKEIEKYFSTDVDYMINQAVEFKITSGKKRSFISNLS